MSQVTGGIGAGIVAFIVLAIAVPVVLYFVLNRRKP